MLWIDVVDTAVKVGLGALISGVTTYKVSKLQFMNSHRSDKGKSMRESLLFITEKSDSICIALSLCYARVGGYLRSGAPTPERLASFISDYKKTCDAPWLEVRSDFIIAHSRLKLIGANDAAAALRAVCENENPLREPIIFNKIAPTQEELAELISKFKLDRENLFYELNKEFIKSFE